MRRLPSHRQPFVRLPVVCHPLCRATALIAITLVLGGCSRDPLSPTEANNASGCRSAQQQTASDEANRGFDLEICDVDGRTVRRITDRRLNFSIDIASPPQRIVSQSLGSDETLFELVEPADFSRLAAVSALSNSPDYSDHVEQAAVVGHFVTDKTEEILAFAPDLVLAASYSTRETIRQLRNANVPTLVLHQFNGVSDAASNVETIAFALFLDQRGHQLTAALRTQVDSARERLAHSLGPAPPRVLAYGSGSVYADGTTFHDLATRLGLNNVPAVEGELRGWPVAHAEQLLTWRPDLVYIGAPYGKEDAAVQQFQRSFPGLFQAPRTTAVVVLPDKLFTTVSQRLGALARVMADRTATVLDDVAAASPPTQ